MTISLTIIIVGVVTLSIGSILGYLARQTLAKGQLSTAEGKASRIISDAEKKAKEEIVQAKNKSIEILDKAEEKMKERDAQIKHYEERLEKRENSIEKREEEVGKSTKKLHEKVEEVKNIRKEVEALKSQERQKLEDIASLTQEDARNQIFHQVEEEAKDNLAQQVIKLEKDNIEELELRANNIMVQVIQRYARSHASEFMTSTVALPSEDMKGKIIGKEGRNIRSLEKETGVEVIVDDSPDTIILSSFDPIRRAIAKIALEKLLEDGRINPARIEEMVKTAEKEINQSIKEAGIHIAPVINRGPFPGGQRDLFQVIGTPVGHSPFSQHAAEGDQAHADLAQIVAALGGARLVADHGDRRNQESGKHRQHARLMWCESRKHSDVFPTNLTRLVRFSMNRGVF